MTQTVQHFWKELENRFPANRSASVWFVKLFEEVHKLGESVLMFGTRPKQLQADTDVPDLQLKHFFGKS